jgi:pimeloyl-ACP methyl ester carboxylesterase
VARPRILLTPSLTELEWPIKPEIEKWADVACFDAPGVGDEPPAEEASLEAIEKRALEELDRQGWDRFVVAGDEYGAYMAVRVASARSDGLAGVALGHACLNFSQDGDRAPVNDEVMSTFARLASVDYRTYVRHLTQITQGAYDEETADAYERRVPQELSVAYSPAVFSNEYREDMEPLLRELDVPMLFVKHEGCLAWSDEGYEDAVAAFPEARTASMELKPSANPEFAELLRDFCDGFDWKDG